MDVIASAHPLPVEKELLAKLVSGVQIGFIAVVLLGKRALDAINLNIGGVISTQMMDFIEQNKFQNVMVRLLSTEHN